MLASNFKTAEELGLVPEALPALIKVLGLLERGEVTWTPRSAPCKNGFNMSPVWEENECGTVGCIAGWAMFIEPSINAHNGKWDHLALGQIGLTSALTNLVCPVGREQKTVEQAAHALRTYLVTGEPEWK